jgi:hypothetical protein
MVDFGFIGCFLSSGLRKSTRSASKFLSKTTAERCWVRAYFTYTKKIVPLTLFNLASILIRLEPKFDARSIDWEVNKFPAKRIKTELRSPRKPALDLIDRQSHVQFFFLLLVVFCFFQTQFWLKK